MNSDKKISEDFLTSGKSAGTWLEIERAEYRLAQSYFKAKDYLNSIKHANLCLTICENNQAGPLEFFYAYESLALIEAVIKQPQRSLSQMLKYFSFLNAEEQKVVEPVLLKIQSLKS